MLESACRAGGGADGGMAWPQAGGTVHRRRKHSARTAVFRRWLARIASGDHGLRSSIIGSESELHVAAERLLEHRQVTRASLHIVLWIKRIAHTKHRLRARHKLHEPLGTLGDCAHGSKPLSHLTTAFTSAGSSPCPWAVVVMSCSYSASPVVTIHECWRADEPPAQAAHQAGQEERAHAPAHSVYPASLCWVRSSPICSSSLETRRPIAASKILRMIHVIYRRKKPGGHDGDNLEAQGTRIAQQ